jgi:hypothetical protein
MLVGIATQVRQEPAEADQLVAPDQILAVANIESLLSSLSVSL